MRGLAIALVATGALLCAVVVAANVTGDVLALIHGAGAWALLVLAWPALVFLLGR